MADAASIQSLLATADGPGASMNIVVFDTSRSEGPRLSGLIKDMGLTSTTTDDPVRLIALIGQAPTRLVLLCSEVFSPEVLGVAETLRERHILEPSQILLVTRHLDESDAIHAMAASIDGVVPWGCGAGYLQAKIGSVTRVLERCERIVNAPPFKPGGSDEDIPLRLLSRTNAWRTAPERMREVVGQTLGQSARVIVPIEEDQVLLEKATNITLTNGAQGVVLRIALGAEFRHAQALTAKLFGEGSNDLIDDMLGELANISMGAVKNVFGSEQIGFTGGLPGALTPGEVLKPRATYPYRQVFAIEVGQGPRLVVHLGMMARSSSQVTVSELREGMVTARDLFNDHGLLLLKGGTRLSTTMIMKLHDILPPREAIPVVGGEPGR